MEHEDRAESLEAELERLDEHSNEVGDQIDDVRRDWEAKEDDPAVPGAQPDPDEEESPVTETPKPSDQLPEEGPAEHVHDDTPGSGEEESPGAHGKERTGTGNPDAAGAEREGDDQGDEPGA